MKLIEEHTFAMRGITLKVLRKKWINCWN
jgi:hypothetical protein